MIKPLEPPGLMPLDRAAAFWKLRGAIQSFLCSVHIDPESTIMLADRDNLIGWIDCIVDGDLRDLKKIGD